MGATLPRTTEEHQDVTVTNAGGHDGGATVDELQTNAVSSHSRRWAHAHVGHKPVGSGTSAPARDHHHASTDTPTPYHKTKGNGAGKENIQNGRGKREGHRYAR